ncbi:type II toxin-antitoxin system HigB family toxin [Candidatus Chloroploca sp. M-50]|uniref:Type II toxin-antitoxin system HigB family toxin n=1 Tax=Candidatus Chloroploca mongolica TaxID=2528176 RepID=A0ABS4D7W7_9CHLR|nr:type II toxin-antitoxin system HigB family toxin [Candidatus Chloroploca mongolica]MBP1465517.1 type II toxin-antitoxin system HigB family toxin [Candidatus Chloroploca mongolica]
MRVIAKKTLREFWETHSDAEQALKAWYQDAKSTDWNNPNDVKRTYANASIIANNRVVFNIRGNNYRLVVAINYDFHIVYIRFVGTHKEYDQIDAEKI